MDRKTKLMAACAIGAVAILLGAGLARCAMAPNDDGAAEDQPAAEQQVEEASGIAAYCGTAWTGEDGATLTLADGTMVERRGDDVQVTYFEVAGESEEDGTVTADVEARHAVNDAEKATVIAVEGSAEAVTLTCDELSLSKTYALDADPDVKVTLTAHDSQLNDLLKSDDAAIEEAISSWAAEHSPYATQAKWDGETYVDSNAGTVTTGFTLNDGAETLVQLQLDAKSGKLGSL